MNEDRTSFAVLDGARLPNDPRVRQSVPLRITARSIRPKHVPSRDARLGVSFGLAKNLGCSELNSPAVSAVAWEPRPTSESSSLPRALTSFLIFVPATVVISPS